MSGRQARDNRETTKKQNANSQTGFGSSFRAILSTLVPNLSLLPSPLVLLLRLVPLAFPPPCPDARKSQAEQPFLFHSPRLYHLHPEGRGMKNIQPASLSPMHGRYHRKKTQAAKPRPAGEQKIPSQNANKFAYIKKKLYLCRRNCYLRKNVLVCLKRETKILLSKIPLPGSLKP